MKKLCGVIAVFLAFCMLIPYTAFGFDKNESGFTVSASGKLEKNGNAYSGLYKEVYYSDGVRASKMNAVLEIGGLEYYLRQGKSYTGIYGNRYYKDGVWCSYINGSYDVDGKKYEFVKGEIETGDESDYSPSFTDKFNLFSGPMSGFYYERGYIDFSFTGYKVYLKHAYYVRAGRLFNGYFDGCYYKNGLADKDYCGIHKADNKKLCFMAGYIYTGIYGNVYYKNGIKSDYSGYKTVDNIRYYLSGGALANGVFDGAYFKNGLVDTSVNGKIKVDDEWYTFVNGITSDGLHDGRWYTDGKFDESVNGIKLCGGLPHYLKNGRLSTGIAEYKGKLRYFKNGELSSYSEWLELDGERYYIENSCAVRGVYEIDGVKYLFDAEGRLCKNREAIFENVVYTSDENGVASLAPQLYVTQRGSTIPYPHEKHPDATIASAGCGVCSAVMIVMNETTYTVTLEEMTQKMLDYGCRIPSGSNLNKAAEMLERDYKITCELTDDNEKLKDHLKKGYLAVANVGKIPLFSLTGGHYVVVAGIKDEDTAIIFDPNVREGKYGSGIRKDISYNSENNEVYASFDTLREDAWYGCYLLFTPTENIALRRSENSMLNK